MKILVLIFTLSRMTFSLPASVDSNEDSNEQVIQHLIQKIDRLERLLSSVTDCCRNVSEIVNKLDEVDARLTSNNIEIVELKMEQGHHDDELRVLQTTTVGLTNTTTELSAAVSDIESLTADSLTPIGTIVGWTPKPTKGSEPDIAVPPGWQVCDGSEILSGPWKGHLTPDLVTDKRFLRGGDVGSVLTFEDDSIQDHEHVDSGHTHQDGGHTHEQASHKHTVSGTSGKTFIDNNGPNNVVEWVGGLAAWGWYHTTRTELTYSVDEVTPEIHASKADIQGSLANVGKVREEYRRGEETKPKNMNVVYIMRIG